MRTRLTYENGSLNPHVGRVGVFWNIPDSDLAPTLWYAIQHCTYDWHHPIDLNWRPDFRLRDAFGNERPLPATGTGQGGLQVTFQPGPDLAGTIRVRQDTPHSGLKLMICRNARPMTVLPLGFAGERVISLPHRIGFQLDSPDTVGARMADDDGTFFDLAGLADLRVQLRGGAPGPRSTALTFVSYRARRI